MKFNLFFDYAKALPPDITVLVRGNHGIGKSQGVYQLGEYFKLRVVERRLSQMTEGDMIGLPDKTTMEGEGVTKFNPPDWYMECCREPRLLFLDELNRATPEILQASFQIAGMRTLNGHKLHPDTRVYAAVNASAEYTVNDMDPALLDRFWVTDLTPDVKDWLVWAKENVSPLIYDFIQTNERHLEHTGNIEPGRIYPSRRSWEKVSRALIFADVEFKPNDPRFYGISFGLLGPETAQAFTAYAKSIHDQLTAENILDEWNAKMKKRVEKFGNEKFNVLIEKIGDYTGKHILKPEQVKNMTEFAAMECFPKELLVTFWSCLVDRPDKKMENIKQYAGDFAELVMKAVDITLGEEKKDDVKSTKKASTKKSKK